VNIVEKTKLSNQEKKILSSIFFLNPTALISSAIALILTDRAIS
jgi:hypothetical protein